MCFPPSDPAACLEIDVAIAHFVLSWNYDLALVTDKKLMLDVVIA